MHKLKWLMVIVGGMMLLPWQPNAAQPQPSPSGYIVVTLDAVKTEQINPTPAPVNLNLMLAGVAGTGSRIQKITWPTELWQPVTLGQELLSDARESIPLFALPEDRMNDELALTLVALDNTKANENWLNTSSPRLLEEMAILTATWLTNNATPNAQAESLKQRLPSALGESASLLGVHAIKFAKARNWGVRSQAYEAELPVVRENAVVGKTKLTYSVRRVGPLCSQVALQAKLRALVVHALGSQKESTPAYLWARSASSFAAAEELLSSIVRLPLEKTYTLKTGTSHPLNRVLFEGRLGPFVYLELIAWESPSPRRLGSFSGLWLASEIEPLPVAASNPRTVALAPRSQESSGAEMTFDLEFSLTNGCRNDAQFVRQSVPATMTVGQRYDVSVTMKNTGTTPWTAAQGYQLGAQNPQDNRNWGFHRIELPVIREGVRVEVSSGNEVTFTFTVTAPSMPGTYNFQWKMVQERVEWFGDLTPNVVVSVTR